MSLIESVKAFFTKGNAVSASDPNYGVSMQFYNPGEPIWSPKNYGSFVKEGYKKNATVYNCIGKISGAASGIKWRLYTNSSMKREITSHPLLTLWKKPNTLQSSGTFMEQLFGYWHIAGNNYIWSFRPNPNEPPLALWLLRPDRIKVVPGTMGIESYVYGYGSKNARLYDAPDVLHLKFPAYDDDFYGLSPIEVAMQLVDQQNEGNAWNVALMQNAGKPASVFFSKGYLSTEQRAQVKDELRRKYSGKKNAGAPLVLEADMTWQSMSMAPYELDWLQSRELNTRDIASIFDVAPELVGDSAGKTFANVSEARQALYLENVLPKLDRVRDHLNIWLVPMWPDLAKSGAYLTYDTSDIEALQQIYQSKKSAEQQHAVTMWNNTLCTLAQAQELSGLTPDPQGDVYKIGDILIRAEKLHEYADQSLTAPAAPPIPQPEPLQGLPPPGSGSGSAANANEPAPEKMVAVLLNQMIRVLSDPDPDPDPDHDPDTLAQQTPRKAFPYVIEVEPPDTTPTHEATPPSSPGTRPLTPQTAMAHWPLMAPQETASYPWDAVSLPGMSKAHPHCVELPARQADHDGSESADESAQETITPPGPSTTTSTTLYKDFWEQYL